MKIELNYTHILIASLWHPINPIGQKQKKTVFFGLKKMIKSFISALQKYIDVDIYGKCGTLKCSRANEDSCWKKVDEDYFFYLAFENSICKDYVTEKFFNAMNHTVVPITLGAANYEELAPKNSFINAWDQQFRNDPKLLATYLQDLIDDPSKYTAKLTD